MAKKKPDKRIELRGNFGDWSVDLWLGKRMAYVKTPQRWYRTKRAAMRAANAWSEATGWPIWED